MYDAIVIGARCAGSPTAMLLARRGYKVLLVDKTTFPSHTISTHYIHQPGIARLERWGLLDRIRASNCPPISKYHLDVGGIVLTGSPPPAGTITDAYCPRRNILDKILVEAAVEAGVEFREGFRVDELLQNGEEVIGIRGRTHNGSLLTEQAAIVIGADGLRSLVARAVKAPQYYTKPSLECAYYTYWKDLPMEGSETYFRDNRLIFGYPTNDRLVCIGVAWTNQEFTEYRAQVEKNYLKTLSLVPDLAERVSRAKRAEKFIGTSHVPNYFRKPYGTGWALVGDAGYHKDPTSAWGISDAFRDADLLSEAIDLGFSGTQPLAEAMANYEQQRNQEALPIYNFVTTYMASLKPPTPEMTQLMRSLQGNQEDIDRFLGILAGTTSITEFFAFQNLFRILGIQGFAKILMQKIWLNMKLKQYLNSYSEILRWKGIHTI